MKLKEYMDLMVPGSEVTCWDKDVDSEFYFYCKEKGEKSLYGDDFPNVERCEESLKEFLDVVSIRDNGIEVNLYELLDNPKVIEFAKKNMFEEYQYEDDADVVMMLFDDNVKNFSNGFEGFSELMVRCLSEAFGPAREIGVDTINGDNSPDYASQDYIAVHKGDLASMVQLYIDNLEDQDVMHVDIVYALLDMFARKDLEEMGFAEFIEDCLDCAEKEKPALKECIGEDNEPTKWICVYKDTLCKHADVNNLVNIEVPTAWLIKALRAEGEADVGTWFDEYTADSTDSLARKALDEGVILNCDDEYVMKSIRFNNANPELVAAAEKVKEFVDSFKAYDDIPDELGFLFKGTWIKDPFYDETLRFEVDPFVHYGADNMKAYCEQAKGIMPKDFGKSLDSVIRSCEELSKKEVGRDAGCFRNKEER